MFDFAQCRIGMISRLLACLLAIGVCQPSALATDAKQIRIISTNDIHSYLRPVYYRYLDETRPWGIQSMEGDYVRKAAYEGRIGGMAHVATVINRLRSEKPGKTLVVDSGDTWHGSGLSVLDKGVSMVKIMNAIGYDAMVPGNWEFFYPKEHLLDLIDQANFPVVAYNLTDKEWGDPVLDQYVVKQVDDVIVAVIGLTYPWTGLTSSVVGSAKWWNFGIKEAEARELIDEIKSEHDPDLIVFISHGGYGLDQKFAKRVDGIDVLVSGHTHNPVFEPVVWNNTIIYESGAHGKYVSSLDLQVKDKKIVSFDYKLVKVNQDYVPADPEIQKLVDEAYQPHADKLNEVVGQSDEMLYRRDYFQSTLGNLITDALRSSQGTDIGFFPAWRYGATLLPGQITVEDIYNIIPTGGQIITFTMAGKEIRTLLENIISGVVDNDPFARVGGDMIRFSGLNIVYDLANSRGDRVVSITTADGQAFSMDKDYTIASVHTRFQDNPLFGARDVKETGKQFADALVEYIRNNSPVTSALDARIGPRKDTALADPGTKRTASTF
ncbi:MAG: bifunctional metallophosphatase/5'-nucleotidase [Arenicellales bacterium]|nr:bifunctional metallophosphatase/5'-nucleotidase [Arenicellales bacterium]